MPLTVVLDTNVLLVSISSRSPFYWLYQALQEERYHLLVSQSIILEYEEIIAEHMDLESAILASDLAAQSMFLLVLLYLKRT